MPEDELGKHIIVTYQRLRLGIGSHRAFFPAGHCGVRLLVQYRFRNVLQRLLLWPACGDLKAGIFPGIFPTRVLFCGLLFALGVFLILYKGFNTPEDILLWIAGVAAIFVAIFPMWYDEMYPYSGFPYEDWFRVFSWIHYGSAIVLFGCMTLVAWFCSKTTLNDKRLIAALNEKEPDRGRPPPRVGLLVHRMDAGFGNSHPVFDEKFADAKRYIRADL